MNSPAKGQVFARYWRTFLPGWLIPVPILAAILLGDFASSATATRVLPYFVVAIFIYMIAVQLPPLGLFRRGEITYFQIFVLSTPMALVGIVCVFIGVFIHTLRS
ncbi:MAG: hypothetical protein QOI22_1202 [Verrucomicrobiota bacterium]|jgi:hypothetical protein